MESVHRSEDRSTLDVNDLLSNGFFKTSRSQKPSSSNYPETLNPTTSSYRESRRYSKSPRRSRRDWPPDPCVEDEEVSLAKEHGGSRDLTPHEPPFRGTLDQQPIILESDISASEADDISRSEKQSDNGERRFVIIPNADKNSPAKDNDLARDRRHKDAKPTEQNAGKRPEGRGLSPPPALSRRRSRQDLPSLKTKLEPEMPSYRRSTSAYAYIPKGNDSARTNLTPSADTLLSPDASTTGRSQKQSYFELAAQALPRKYSTANPGTSRPGTPVEEKRRSTGPLPTDRPGTPVSDRRDGNVIGNGRLKQDMNDRNMKPPRSVEENPRRSSQFLSAEPERRYSSSDDDLSDSGKRHRHRRSHSRHHGHGSLHPEDDRDRHHHHHHHHRSPSGRGLDAKSASRSSPLPSPKVSPSQLPATDKYIPRKDGYSSGRENKRPVSRSGSPVSDYSDPSRSSKSLNPGDIPRAVRTHSRRSSPVNIPDAKASSATLPIPIPIPMSGDGRKSPSTSRYDEDPVPRSASARPDSQKQTWPPSFQPSNSEPPQLDKPMGAYRRHSQDVEEGNIAPLPPCPRTMPTRGKSDWLTLAKAPNFNICPSCFNSSVAQTEFRSHFVPAPLRSPQEGIVCDFGGQPWYRIAWLLTRKERLRDLSLIYSIYDVTETHQPCLGKHHAVRRWHSVVDPETKLPIRDFDVCSSCCKCIEALLPSLRGIFVRTNNSDLGHPRQCDLRFDSKRFIHYFDSLETMADDATHYRHPDTRDFAELARKFARVPECPRDDEIKDGRWHVIRELPEFTVCPECFDEIVLPERKRGKAIASMFSKTPQTIPSPTSCQLYSPRMRAIFEKAVKGDDYKLLAAKARDRRRTEIDLKADIAEQRKLSNNSKAAAIELARLESEWKKWE